MKGLFLVYSGPADSNRDGEYNRWYDDVHVPDMLRVPGVVACTRYRLGATQVRDPGPAMPYLAVYEVELDDLADLPALLAARGKADGAPPNEAVAIGPMAIWEQVAERTV